VIIDREMRYGTIYESKNTLVSTLTT
jgi:hypothetical protein